MKIKEFKEVRNPHSNLKKKKEENKFNNQIKIDNNNYINEQKQNIVIDYDMDNTDFSDDYLKAEEKRLEMLENKNESPAIKAKKLLEEGLINSFVDFFYIYQKKIPNIAINYQKISELPLSEFKESEDHTNNLTTIKVKLVLAEKKYMRLKNYPLVINKFLDIRTIILQHQDYNSSVYFNQKAIDIAKSRELMDYLLFSFLFMGDCFQNADDSIIRIQFKENAKQLFEKHGSKNNKLNLDKFLYESLMKLYEELAVQQENQNNHENAIKFLVKQLDNLKSLKMIVKDYNDKSRCEQDEIRIYLKVAELNYKQNKYEDANLYLDIAKDLLSKKSDDQNVSIVKY